MELIKFSYFLDGNFFIWKNELILKSFARDKPRGRKINKRFRTKFPKKTFLSWMSLC